MYNQCFRPLAICPGQAVQPNSPQKQMDQGPIKCLWWQLMRMCIRQPLETDCTNFAKWSSVEILKGLIKVQISVQLKLCGELEVGNTCNKPFKDHIVKDYLFFHLCWTKVFLFFGSFLEWSLPGFISPVWKMPLRSMVTIWMVCWTTDPRGINAKASWPNAADACLWLTEWKLLKESLILDTT